MELLVRRVLSVRSATAPRLGAGGLVFYLSDVTGVQQLWFFDGSRHDVYAPVEGRVGDYRVSKDGVVAVAVDRDGDEKWRLYLLGDDLMEVSAEGVNSLGAWSPDGSALAFTSTKDSPSDFHLYVYRRGEGEVERLAELGGINVVEEWSEAGIFVTHYETNLDSTIYLFRDGELKELTKHSGEALNFSPRYVGGGKALFLTNADWEYVGVAQMDLATGSWKYLVQLDRDVERFDVWGNYLVFSVNEEGRSGLYQMHIPSGLTYKLPAPAGVATHLEYRDGVVLFSLSAVNKGHEVYVYKDGAVRQLTRSPRFGAPLEQIPEPRSVWYPSFDGRKIQANIYAPPGEPRGVVVYLHGGPESQDRPEFKPLVAAMVSAGLLVAAPNYRGSTGFGKSFVHLDDVERRWDAVRDVEVFAKWLQEEGIARGRPCVAGGSYGGYLTLMALATAPDLWACGVEMVGIFNLVSFLERTAAWRRRYREAEYGSLDKQKDVLVQLSPASHVDKIRAPLMVVHGANDIRVPVYEAEQLVQRLRELGREAKALILPDEGHVITKVENRVKVYTEVIKFILQHV
ncbi:MAG: S9 family peptidase [Pyrobaculum arsenaticum]|uniref:Peptidase S9, prolyl oligopeptidase active site domain protein n=2 Tax=Pyrobaculum arsenaticum TaxID=121277 RepID=A4WHW7_PYRAR|nr:S9 family peptidase [Pyrobaculum arsenaticum]ABP49984.1 peptidase S9, prolyl oligopeptidase active site domain protein [Pyrobaculum arsenaticum DSM 13514]MCY0889522.1 S9 family peptidase [Pyrobaculum arsenaticum]NYR15047.1 S9 family peptidase [Pyrobaculum arsenaticum]